MKRIILSAILAFVLILSVFPQTGLAADADEQSKAVEYVAVRKIFVGDGNGNLNLESGLTRAELAVLLVRLRGDEEKVSADIKNYTMDCYFTDVPAWAKPSVGYCAGEGLMIGYSLFSFGPDDPVTPQQACTVILRHMGIPETDWSYATAIPKAGDLGLTPAAGFADMAAIRRAEMAILIYKSLVPGGNGNGSVSATPTDWVFQLNASVVPMQSYIIEGELHVRLWEMCRWLDVYVGMEQSAVVIDFEKAYTDKKVYYQSKTVTTAAPSAHTLKVNGITSRLDTYLINDELFISIEDIATWKGVLAVPDSKYSNSYLIDTGKRMAVDNSDIAARDAARAEIIRLVNEERARAGVSPLKVLDSLMECAQIKAEDMFVNEYYSHTSPTYGTYSEMIRALVPEPVAVCGENIAMTRPTAQRVFEAWINSSGHYAAMIDPDWTHAGVGAAKLEGYGYLYWALQFAVLQ